MHYEFGDEGTVADQEANELLTKIKAASLCNRIFLLSDKDKGKETKHQKLAAAQNGQFKYEVTPGIEIENLLPPQALHRLVPQLFGATVDSAKNLIKKHESYRQTALGTYFRKTFNDQCPAAIAKKKGGTLSKYYKDKLSQLFVKADFKWDDLGDDVQTLTRKLYTFLLSHNRNSQP